MHSLVIIPTYNESENIPRLITEIFVQLPDTHILIVDDNSPDQTGNLVQQLGIANSRIHLLRRRGKLGLGSAYREGFAWALQQGYEFIIQMDADFSHPPRFLPLMIQTLTEYDLVIGSRYISDGKTENWPWHRQLLSRTANIYAQLVTAIPVRDLTGGFKGFRRKVLEQIPWKNIRTDGYSFQIETNFWAYRQGARLKEIPIVFPDRLLGVSKISRSIVWEALGTVLKLGTIRFLRK